MTEDLDKDLENLAGDLDDLDLGDLGGGDEAAAAPEEGGADLGDLDLGGGEEAAAAPEEGGEGAGGEGVDLDDELQSMLDSESGPGGGGGAAASGGGSGGGGGAAAPAPAPAAPSAQELMASLQEGQTVNLEFLLDIKLHVTFEVGRSKMLISDLLTLGQGSVIELHRLVGDELDLLVNGKLIAKGEVVVVNEKFGCKITEIIPPEERIKHLGSI